MHEVGPLDWWLPGPWLTIFSDACCYFCCWKSWTQLPHSHSRNMLEAACWDGGCWSWRRTSHSCPPPNWAQAKDVKPKPQRRDQYKSEPHTAAREIAAFLEFGTTSGLEDVVIPPVVCRRTDRTEPSSSQMAVRMNYYLNGSHKTMVSALASVDIVLLLLIHASYLLS